MNLLGATSFALWQEFRLILSLDVGIGQGER